MHDKEAALIQQCRRPLVGASLALAACAALAAGKPAPTAPARPAPPACRAAHTHLPEALHRTGCELAGMVEIDRYASPRPASPQATELDQRQLVIATGKQQAEVDAAAGLKPSPAGALMQTRLLQPPLAARVAQRYPAPPASKYRQWAIAYERVMYAAEGVSPGFTLECATAVRSAPTAAIVAECFPYKERARFSRVLDALP